MNKFIFALSLLLVSSHVFAVDDVGFFESVAQSLTDVRDAFYGIPSLFERMFANIILYLTLAKISFQIWMMEIAMGTAKALIVDLNVTGIVNDVFSNIPPTVGHYMNLYDVPNMVQFLIECGTTRFVLNFMGIK